MNVINVRMVLYELILLLNIDVIVKGYIMDVVLKFGIILFLNMNKLIEIINKNIFLFLFIDIWFKFFMLGRSYLLVDFVRDYRSDYSLGILEEFV